MFPSCQTRQWETTFSPKPQSPSTPPECWRVIIRQGFRISDFQSTSHAEGCRLTVSVNTCVHSRRRIASCWWASWRTWWQPCLCPTHPWTAWRRPSWSWGEKNGKQNTTPDAAYFKKKKKKEIYKIIVFPFSANPAYHELLLTVLWYGVVHTSALVRCTAARMFEVQKHTHQRTRGNWSWLCSIFKILTGYDFLIPLNYAKKCYFLNSILFKVDH